MQLDILPVKAGIFTFFSLVVASLVVVAIISVFLLDSI